MSKPRRVVFGAVLWIALLNGHTAAFLARAYRRLLRVDIVLVPLAVPASLVVLVLWAFPRVGSRLAVSCCMLVAGEHGRA